MNPVLFVLLAISFAEYSYQDQSWDFGPVSESVKVGDAVPPKYDPLTPNDERVTDMTLINTMMKWNELITSKDPLPIDLDPIPLPAGFTLNLTSVVITGLSQDRLLNIEVRTNYTDVIRVDTKTYDPALNISANFDLYDSIIDLKGHGVLILTDVLYEAALNANIVTESNSYSVSGAEKSYTIGDATLVFDLDNPTSDRSDRDDIKEGIIKILLEFASRALLSQDTAFVNAVVPPPYP